ncbi:hypothetical protein KHP62_05015 [Rhodobacteraceae bacterium NNCM2]|nr:hypothetical protein [Coraliihabitans acroporae]
MKFHSRTLSRVFIVGIAAAALAGCAAEEARDTEQLLSAAGFEMKLADTPERMAHLETLQQRQLISHQTDSGLRYTYADAAGCKCLYSGDEQNYQDYQKLAVKEKIARQEEMTAAMNQQAAMNWGLWGWGY